MRDEHAPTARDDSATTPMNTPVTVAVLANDTDPDGDTPMLVALGLPQQGSLSVNPDQTITYTPAPGFLGQDEFTYTISDGWGGSDTATVTVTVGNPGSTTFPNGYAYRRRLVDDRSLGAVLADRGADLVLCGHEHELKLGSLPGPAHRIPVVVAPSASQGAPPKQQGGYLVYTLEGQDGRWRIGFELRAFDVDTGLFRTVTAGRLGEVPAPAG